MSSSSSTHSPGSGDKPDEHFKVSRSERMYSLAIPKDPQHTVMNLPNISISNTDGDKINQLTEPGEAAQRARYEGLRYLIDMTGGSYEYAGLGLTEKFPGSVARARAQAERRLQESKKQQVYTTPPTNFTPKYTGRSLVTMEKTLRDRYNGPVTSALDNESITSAYPSSGKAAVPNAIASSNDNKEAPKPDGKWRCCKCHRGYEIYSFAKGQHPVSVLSCECTHRSCSKCTLEGLVKHFVPMSEPELIPLSEDKDKVIRFGVFCEGCGLSWRAEKVQDEVKKKPAYKSALLRVSAVPRRLTMRGGVHPLERLRLSRSMNNLHDDTERQPSAVSIASSRSVLSLRSLSSDMKRGHGEQAESVSVKFTGIKCTCGMTTETSSLCFQTVDPPKDFRKVQFAKQVVARNVARFGSTPEDRARGHGTPTLTLKGSRHPNPLRSNPVE
ncbi:uncharacterized protein ALTATR162_LOCUS10544 [Alternaria atra]|uniref:Probable double zinc ribbon domain-containing protein n=1 Tax=Alternaria atra TaxID=119953 RepID=A0A8J2N4R8_9PLEO|nr:uncharacterized protein ALTATR162_LOCUS8200 [Alternaria atra]XP_043174115.1 uncharacterized protein ALTATR162_LOCUS10544 [Alternaria atra]CAG5175785.1 unnamed protein product [Alternaria atra]CAG5183363.1 unnamed protein product [Alternaria atra]